MIFYIFLGIIAIAGIILTVVTLINWWWESPGMSILMAFLALVGTVAVLFLSAIVYAGIAGAGAGTETVRSSYGLKALTNGTEQIGEYSGGIFVSYGTSSEGRTIDYIWTDSEGLYNLAQVSADSSKIKEVSDGSKATLEVIGERKVGNIWIPTDWARGFYGDDQSYIFTVPEGTIGSEITIDNGK
jgi:phosphotransferase system  glucose/maltose/N-acetylglucosamine-specific IIC component